MFTRRKISKARKKKYALLTSVSVLLVIVFVLLMAAWSSNTVAICDGGVTKSIKTQKSDVHSVLEEAGISVSDYDSVQPSLDSGITNNMTITIKRAVKLSVSDDGKKTEYFSSGDTVQDVLNQTGYTVGELDKVYPALANNVSEGMEIEIRRAKNYTLIEKDGEKNIKSAARTVGELLEEIEIYPDDETEVSLDSEVKLKDGMKIKVSKVNVKHEKETETIPYTTEKRNSSSLEKGTTKVVQKGVNGEKVITYAVKYKDGVEVDREVVDTTVKKEAVKKIIEVGTKEKVVETKKTETSSKTNSNNSKPTTNTNSNNTQSDSTEKKTETKTPASSGGGKDFSYSRVETMTATAYDLSYESCGKNPGDPYYGITASGMKAQYGVIAVDPRVIPLGTKLYVEAVDGSWTYGYCVAGDTGGGIKGNRIDLFYNSRREALNFGRRQAKVYFLN